MITLAGCSVSQTTHLISNKAYTLALNTFSMASVSDDLFMTYGYAKNV